MDLIIDQSKIVKVRMKMISIITVVSFLLSFIQIKDMTLVFILPMFYMSFMCGYTAIISFFIGLTISSIINMNYIYIIMLLVSFIFLMTCMMFHSMDSKYIPYMLTLISGIYYSYINTDIYLTLIYVSLTFINILVFSNLVPVFIHGNTELLTHARLKSIGVVSLICTLCILPYSSIVMFIVLRVILLIYIYLECSDDILPGLFYISLYILMQSINYKNDILCLLLPVAFFYMVKVKHKFTIVSLYLISHIIIPFICDFSYNTHGIMIIGSALLFLFVPIHKNKPVTKSNEIVIKNQLSKQVDSFCRLFEQMTNLFNQIPTQNHTSEYIGYIYEDMCQHCTSQDTCFNQKYGPNRLIKLMNKGLVDNFNETDHKFINEYCLKSKQYKDIIRKYKNDYKQIERIQSEYQNMKKEVYHQFSLLNDVFHQFSSKLTQGSIEEQHIYKHMISHQFKLAHLKKYYESQSVYYIEVGLYEVSEEDIVNDFIPILETYLNETLTIHTLKSPMKKLGYTHLVLSHKTRYYTQYGIVQCSKEPKVCGDSYEVFAMHEHMYFALSDGMGQGEKAREDSLLTLDVFKQLIINGISLKDTVQSINSLLKIKNRNDMFTTLDMCEINLSLGLLRLAKYGACPTYILRENEIIELSAKSLPVGIVSPLKTSVIKYQLKEHDIIFMISDGFQCSFKEFLEEHIYSIKDVHPKEINHIIMNLLENDEKNDDMTLLTIKVCKQ